MTQHILRVTKDFVLSLERRTAIHDGTNQSDLFVIEQPEELDGFVCTLDFRNSAFKNKFIVTDKTFPMYAEMAVHGRLDLQLEYSQGDTVRLTNMVQMPIGESINAFDHLDPANANVLGQLAEQVRYLEKRVDALGDGGGGIQGERGEQGIQGERGEQGVQGIQGERGEQGIQGERGEQGEQGEQGVQGIQGERGERGEQGIQGERGEDGRDGQDGLNGTDGADGLDGLSAFELAKENGFVGTLQEWLASLQGGGGGEPPYYGVERVVYYNDNYTLQGMTGLIDPLGISLKNGATYNIRMYATRGTTDNVSAGANALRGTVTSTSLGGTTFARNLFTSVSNCSATLTLTQAFTFYRQAFNTTTDFITLAPPGGSQVISTRTHTTALSVPLQNLTNTQRASSAFGNMSVIQFSEPNANEIGLAMQRGTGDVGGSMVYTLIVTETIPVPLKEM